MTDLKTFSKKRFIKDGYCVFDFNKNLVSETKKKIINLISNSISKKYNQQKISEKKIIGLYKSKYKKDIINSLNHIGFFPELFSFVNEKKIIKIIHEIGLKFPVVGFNNLGGRGGLPFLYSFPNDKKRYYQPHQDFFYLPYSQNSVTLWIPLQNTSKKNGALRVIPKSHYNFELFNHSAKDVKFNRLSKHFAENEFKTINVKLGQALIFSSFLVHKTGSNSSNQIRMSFNIRYNDLFDKEYINRGLSFNKFPDNKLK
tara:strand:- start:1219 stop:1989 length:771 start_codon:yes stop_codon:yes gene_type:complete